MRFPSQVLINGLNQNRMVWGRGTNTSTAKHFSFYQIDGRNNELMHACVKRNAAMLFHDALMTFFGL